MRQAETCLQGIEAQRTQTRLDVRTTQLNRRVEVVISNDAQSVLPRY